MFAVRIISGTDQKFYRISKTVYNCMELCVQSSTCSSDEFFCPFLKPPFVLWCAFAIVESMLKFSISASLESVWKIFPIHHLSAIFWILHRHSAMVHSILAFLSIELPFCNPQHSIQHDAVIFAGRPLLPVRSGSLSLILSHSRLLISYRFILLFYHFSVLCASFIFQTRPTSSIIRWKSGRLKDEVR